MLWDDRVGSGRALFDLAIGVHRTDLPAVCPQDLADLVAVFAGGAVGHGVGGGDRSGVLHIALFELMSVFGGLVLESLS
ncbi:hypothetical protein ACQP0C_00900 [Nocardia sp. CA-129566]|uniref:hypothetical protein n=1 Tax=Nocardia sp. CA-129566 TaxID=3239976 RepID=UPI003D979643